VKDVIVRSVENDEELHQANSLMARSREESHADVSDWLNSFGAGYPGYRPEHTRVALFGSQVVAALRLTTDTIRIGEARLKMGGLGWVATDGAWGRRGIVSRLVTDTLRYMREHRYHVSMLFGVSELYRRWGFAATIAQHTTIVDLATRDISPPDRPFKMRAAKPGDIQAIQKMHGLNDTETSCSLIRTQAHLANKWKHWDSVRVLTDGRGKLSAYFRGAPADSDYAIDELGVADEDACTALLHAAAGLAEEAGARRLAIAAPPNHPLIRHLCRCHPCQERNTPDKTCGMMAFANLGEALESMIPEWENRLVNSTLTGCHAEATLIVGRTAWRVRAHHSAVDVTPGTGPNKLVLSPQELIQLTTGCLALEECLAAKRRMLNTGGLALLQAIFPMRMPYVWVLDRF
jgi:predicted acetyltransferase